MNARITAAHVLRQMLQRHPQACEGAIKIVLALTALAVFAALAGCGGGEPWPDDACEDKACVEPDIPAPSQPAKPPPDKRLPPGWRAEP